MKKFVISFLLIFTIAFTLQAHTLAQAEKMYQEGDFATAQKEYENLLPSLTGDSLYQAQLRLAACQYSQGEYLTAIKTMLAYPLPASAVWQARFLLYRTHMAAQVSQQYNRILEEREIENNQDPEKWTQRQWNEQIQQDYERIWALRGKLIEVPIEQETLILNLKDTDTQRIATLFDFATYQWTQWLTRNKIPTLPQPISRTYLNNSVSPLPSENKFVEQLADILQTAYLLEGDGRQNARVFWHADYILLPFEQEASFEIKNTDKALKSAVAQLNTLSGYTSSTSLWHKLKGQLTSKDALYGKSYAAYQTAQLLWKHDERAHALAICKYAQSLEKNYYVSQCQELLSRITQPEISFDAPPQALHPQKPQIKLNLRNIEQLHVRVYPVTKAELEQWYYATDSKRNLSSWSQLTQLSNQTVSQILASNKKFQTLQDTISYSKEYFPTTYTLTLPALEKGFYVVLASADEAFEPSVHTVAATVLNVTDLALFITTGIRDNPEKYVRTLQQPSHTYQPEVFRIYTVNLKTGEWIPNVALDIITDWKGDQTHGATNGEGFLSLPRSVKVARRTNNSYSVDVWAGQAQDTAFSQNSAYFHFYANTPVRLFAQTDRAVYRPGQKVELSVQGFQTTAQGWQVLEGRQVDIVVRSDENGKQVFKTTSSLNEFGTIQTHFTLPEGNEVVLGNFSVQVTSTIAKETFHAYHTFSVEEYKRPEYEIVLNEPKQPLAYEQKATVTGKASYYTGANVQQATVKYTITRQEYIPPFYWWRMWRPAPIEQVAQGQITTDDKGEFSLSWVPSVKQKDEVSTQYTVRAEVYDASGRPIEVSRTYKVSKYPQLFKVNFTQGFYDANTPAPLADITLTNADGQPIAGTVTARISRVQDNPKAGEGNSLDAWYQNVPDKTIISTQTLTFSQTDAQTVQLPAVPEGIYRLTLKAQQAQTQTMIFVVAAQQSHLQLPAIALPQHTTYYPGETARILVGSHSLVGSKQIEVYRKRQFLSKTDKLPGGMTIYAYPVTEQDRGGLGISWFGASGYQFYQAAATITVPFDNQEITARLDTPAIVKPGQTVSWTLTAKNLQHAPVNGQASVSVYDKSLDYYAQKKNPFTLSSLFSQDSQIPSVWMSQLPAQAIEVFTGKNAHTWYQPAQLPTLNLVMQHLYYRNFRSSRGMLVTAAAPMAMMAKSADGGAMEEMATYGGANQMLDTAIVEEDASFEEPAPDIRTDFAENAYFNTLLPVTNGKARVHFVFPQSVTTWNILGFVLTKTAQFGAFTASTITRKDLMVQLHLPRFYRERDKGVLQASVVNLTNRKITVPVTLSIQQNNQDKATLFGVQTPAKTVSVAPNSTGYVQWEITVPANPGLYNITVVGRYGADSDAEQRTLPVFPALTRLLASAHRALQNGENTLEITELNKVPDAQAELATLALHPSLALSVLNSMPNVLASPHKDLISSLNRYVPLAVVNTFYTAYPALKEAVQKLPKRTGLTATWNEQDPLRLTLLEQTPWLQDSLGKPERAANMINLFEESVVSRRLAQEKANILTFQNSDGSFSWFVGGPSDTYLTLRALESFSQAVQFGAAVPEESAQKALAYVVPKIETQLKQDQTGSAGTVAYALFAAYTLSAFPAYWEQVASAKPYIQKWMDYADQEARFMTPLGMSYAAAVYHRLGDDIKANAYLDKVLARMKYNALTGAYFAPEAQSWVWYQDTLTTQTATLKTLLEIRPQATQIDSMVQWLLFNRQVTSWQNPAAAAKAIYVLLDVMKAKGALSSAATYQIKWADTHVTQTFEPFDWTENLQWVKQAEQLSPAVFSATVTKQGKMTDFASLNVIYTSAEANASPKGVLNVNREYFIRATQDGTQILRPVKEREPIKVGDEVEVHLTLNADSAFDYVQVTDPKPAGFESADLRSSWMWNPVSMYREVRDADTNFFIDHLPAGTVSLKYVLRPTVPGIFHAKPAQAQSMYAPEYGAHTAAGKLQVDK